MKNKQIKLTKVDEKLLAYLYHNGHLPFSKIAKATKLSRDQVEYRINKYVREGLIKGFFTLFDYSKIGMSYLGLILLKFEKHSALKKFEEKVKGSKNVLSWGRAHGQYDVYIDGIFKDEKDLANFVSSLFNDKEIQLQDYLMLNPYYSELFPLKFFYKNSGESFNLINQEVSSKVKLDERDKIILKEISNNARDRLVDIAVKAKISAELAHYKLKKLEREKVIVGSRLSFDMSKLGYFFTVVLIHLPNMTRKNQEKLKNFGKQNKYINGLGFVFNKPNCYIQFFHKTETELRKGIDELRNTFSDEKLDLEIVFIEEEKLIDTLPFL